MSSVAATKQEQSQASALSVASRTESSPSLLTHCLTAGVAACWADLVTFPLDTVKVRQQVQGQVVTAGPGGGQQVSRSLLATVLSVVRLEGFTALYSGLVPGLQRQLVFSSLRIGLYERMRNGLFRRSGLSTTSTGAEALLLRVTAGLSSGSFAICVAQPMDVVKIRMQAAGRSSQYRGVVDAYVTIGRREGVYRGLYRGLGPNIGRNGIVNACETVVYDVTKNFLITRNLLSDGMLCHFCGASVAGFIATLFASPVDVIKTRYMNSSAGSYKTVFHCALQTGRQEGLAAFYKGFSASAMRIISWNIVLWTSYEQLKKALNTHYYKN